MNESTPNINHIQDMIQDAFDVIDQQLSSYGTYPVRIAELPQLSRDLYLVHDLVAITCNSGIRAWIHYHHDEPGWIECAEEAFTRIGHPQVNDGIRSCLTIYLAKHGDINYEDDEVPSAYIMDHEDEIKLSLYTYLVTNNFVFPK